jgi:hypothetical protein
MAFFTKAEARDAAQSRETITRKPASRILLDSVTASTGTQSFDIFLSHSIKDEELILGVKELLEKMSFSVYVDWAVDGQLDRSKVTAETADLLRSRMKQSNSLIYVATENATQSKWMPWELGFFDGHKPSRVAVLPLLDSAQSAFKEQEYLSLYPNVTKSTYKGSTKEEMFVIGKKWMTLKDFPNKHTEWNSF